MTPFYQKKVGKKSFKFPPYLGESATVGTIPTAAKISAMVYKSLKNSVPKESVLEHNEKYQEVMQQMVSKKAVLRKWDNIACKYDSDPSFSVPDITTEDVISVIDPSKCSNIDVELLTNFITPQQELIQTLPNVKVEVSHTLYGQFFPDNFSLLYNFRIANENIGGDGLTTTTLPEASGWTQALFHHYTAENANSLYTLSLYADIASNVATFMISHKVITALGAGVGVCWLQMAYEQGNLGSLYRNVATELRYKIPNNLVNTFKDCVSKSVIHIKVFKVKVGNIASSSPWLSRPFKGTLTSYYKTAIWNKFKGL